MSCEEEKKPTTPPFPQRLGSKKVDPTIDAIFGRDTKSLCEDSLVTGHLGNTNL